MSEVKVSIIIPFYNVEKYIEQCIESVVNQTLSEIEVIFVDDASTDKTTEIVSKYCEQDNRLRLIKLEKHSGQGVARNVAICEANGEYIGFVDSDDWVEKTMFEKLYNNAKTNQTDISMCGAKIFDNMTGETLFQGYYTLECLQKQHKENEVFCVKDVYDDILNINVALWNKVYNREFLISTGEKLPEGYIFEDMPFFFATFLKAQKIGFINENLYYYRINRSESTMTKTGEKLSDRVDMLALTFRHIKNSDIFIQVKSKIINWIIDDIFVNANGLDSAFFPPYFEKINRLFLEIGLEDIKANAKNITFNKAVLMLQQMDPETAQHFIYNFFISDKKLDGIYRKISEYYDSFDGKIYNVYQEITKNYDFTNNLATQKQNELRNEISSLLDGKINEVNCKINDNYEFTKELAKQKQEELRTKLNFDVDGKFSNIYQEITNNYEFTKELARQKQEELRSEINSTVENKINLNIDNKINSVVDEKFQKVNLEITNNYEFTKELARQKQEELRFEVSVSIDEKVHKVYEEITNNYEFTKDFANQKQNELRNELNSKFDWKIEEINQNIINNYELSKQQDFLIKEEIYSKISEQYEETNDICNKNIYVAKQETEQKFFEQTDRMQLETNKMVETLRQNLQEDLHKTISSLKTEFENEKECLKKEFERKINIEHAACERKLMAMQEKYDEEIANMSPIIKFINKLGRKNGKR